MQEYFLQTFLAIETKLSDLGGYFQKVWKNGKKIENLTNGGS